MCCCSYLECSPVEFALKADGNDAESWVYTVPVINPALNPAVRANGSFAPNSVEKALVSNFVALN